MLLKKRTAKFLIFAFRMEGQGNKGYLGPFYFSPVFKDLQHHVENLGYLKNPNIQNF